MSAQDLTDDEVLDAYWHSDAYSENHARFLRVMDECAALRAKKFSDYGNAYEEHGSYGVIVRMTDKFNRVNNLYKQDAKIKNETIRDTLMDVVNYAIMAIMLVDAEATEPPHRK